MAWEVWKFLNNFCHPSGGLICHREGRAAPLFLPSLLRNMEQRRVSDVHPDGLIGWGLDSGDHSSRMGTGQWGSQQKDGDSQWGP